MNGFVSMGDRVRRCMLWFIQYVLFFSSVPPQCSSLRCCRCWGVQVGWGLPWSTRKGNILGWWHATHPSGVLSKLPRMWWRDWWALQWEAARLWVKHRLVEEYQCKHVPLASQYLATRSYFGCFFIQVNVFNWPHIDVNWHCALKKKTQFYMFS